MIGLTKTRVREIAAALETSVGTELVALPSWQGHFVSIEAPLIGQNEKDGCTYMFPIELDDETVAHIYSCVKGGS